MSVLEKRTYLPADERRKQVLRCALEVFASNGYHGTTVADVCKLAGIGRGTLYQYFTDKRDLLIALAEGITGGVLAAIAARPRPPLTPGYRPSPEEILAFVELQLVGVLQAAFADADTSRLILRVGRGADGVVDEILRRVDDAVLGAVEEELRLAKAAGIARDLDERLVARYFVGGIENVVLMYLDEGKPIDVAHIAREAALLEVFGLIGRAGSAESTPNAAVEAWDGSKQEGEAE
ncbi:MAG: TetR/AcrR family transcriptional regulator [Myxococcales bacterium]|nr:TetR/AcrR family transcriptional regulator [Myxococcales bacterium]